MRISFWNRNTWILWNLGNLINADENKTATICNWIVNSDTSIVLIYLRLSVTYNIFCNFFFFIPCSRLILKWKKGGMSVAHICRCTTSPPQIFNNYLKIRQNVFLCFQKRALTHHVMYFNILRVWVLTVITNLSFLCALNSIIISDYRFYWLSLFFSLWFFFFFLQIRYYFFCLLICKPEPVCKV